MEAELSNHCKYITVKLKTTVKIDYSVYENDLSLKGEFVRSVREDPFMTEEEKKQVIAYGLNALLGRPVELS